MQNYFRRTSTKAELISK